MSDDDLDRMTPEEIREWAERQRAASREAFAGQPVPEISRVKRDDHPHWKVVAYMFHTRSGDRVLVGRGDGRRSRAPSVAYAPRAGTTSYWSSSWARRGRARGPTVRTGRPIGRAGCGSRP